jgi:hypothetical protein
MDAFISYSSANQSVASKLEKSLEATGLRAWLDDSEIRLGMLLGKELQDSIRASRVLILLWSRHAASSRWVASEWLTAFHLNRYIVPCVLDDTPLPQCLQESVFLRMRQVTASVVERLVRAVREAPDNSNQLTPVMRAESPEVSEAIAMVAAGQQALLEQLSKREFTEAAQLQVLLSDATEKALQAWPLEPMIVNLAGYNLKNAYMLKHWDAIQAGRSPDDLLLAQAEQRFFETLAIEPTDPSALNGLGSILMFRRDLDAAEFFIHTATAQADRQNRDYPEAEADLALIRRFKSIEYERRPAEQRPPARELLADDSVPRSPEGSAVDSTRPGDRVECSVFAPPMVSPGSVFLIQVFAHISGRAREAMHRAKEFDADSARRAIKTLESSVSRGTKLAFCLTMPGLQVDDPMQSMVWSGTTESVQFGVSVPERCHLGGVVGTITISQDSIPIGHIKFTLTVAAILPADQAHPAPSISAVGDAAKRYETAFVSYASADRTKVLERVQVLPMFKIKTFQDVLDLGPGERWEQSLYRHIDESDIFLLFWSNAAKRSKWVRKEVQYALDRKHGDEWALPEIGPVIIEGPPVPPPWKELAHLHFNDRIIYFTNR